MSKKADDRPKNEPPEKQADPQEIADPEEVDKAIKRAERLLRVHKPAPLQKREKRRGESPHPSSIPRDQTDGRRLERSKSFSGVLVVYLTHMWTS
jgi:hypothetical protein